MANRLMEFLLRKKNTENGATDFAPLVKVEGANSAGIMPDGSFAQRPYVEPQAPVIEHIQIDQNGQPIANVEFHPQRGGGLGTKLRHKVTNALFGEEQNNSDSINAENPENLGIVVAENPRKGGLFNDLTHGYNENRLNGFNLRNWGNNELPYDREKGLAYRIGEGAGSISRGLNRGANALGKGLRRVGQFAETPLGRGLIVGGLVLGTGGAALPALAYGGATTLGNQQNRMKDSIYRNQLKNLGLSDEEVNAIRGYVSDDVYKNISDTYKAKWNKTSWGELANFNPVIAEAVQSNPSLANSFVPASVANTILKGELTDAQIANLVARTKETESRIGVAKQNADTNALRTKYYGKYVDKYTGDNDLENEDLAEFVSILGTRDKKKIEYARSAYIKQWGKDPYKLIKE